MKKDEKREFIKIIIFVTTKNKVYNCILKYKHALL